MLSGNQGQSSQMLGNGGISSGGAGGGQGGANPSGFLIQTGLSDAAAQAAYQAMSGSIQNAQQEYTTATNTAIQQMMQEYGAAYNTVAPQLQQGGYAGAELNYLLGLPSLQTPISPTQTGLPQGIVANQAGINITPGSQQSVQNYINQNIVQNPNGSFTYKPTGTIGSSAADLLANANVLNNAQYNTQTAAFNPTQNQINQYIEANTTRTGNGQAAYTYTPTGTQGTDIIGNANKMANGVAGLAAEPAVQANALQGETQQLQNQYNAYNSALQGYGSTQNGLLYNQGVQQFNTQLPVANFSQALGQATPQSISNVVSNLPGFQSQFNQGTKAIDNSASARGLLGSGNMLEELNQFGQGMESTYYNNYIQQLANEAGVGNTAANNLASSTQGLGTNLASLQTNLGGNIASGDIALGQAGSTLATSPLSAYTNRYVPTIPQNADNVWGGMQSQKNPQGQALLAGGVNALASGALGLLSGF